MWKQNEKLTWQTARSPQGIALTSADTSVFKILQSRTGNTLSNSERHCLYIYIYIWANRAPLPLSLFFISRSAQQNFLGSNRQVYFFAVRQPKTSGPALARGWNDRHRF
ncbi:unnamed protein product [Musa hybrid cultivar]